MGKLRVASAYGTTTDNNGIIVRLSSTDLCYQHIQFPTFGYLSGTFYTGEGAINGKSSPPNAGNVASLRFNPGGVAVSDTNVAYFFTVSWMVI